MAKRSRIESCQDEEGGRRKQRRSDISNRPSLAQPQHLYLVLDDWERGYSIHRFDEDDLDYHSDEDDSLDGARPAASPVVRIEARHPHSWSFAAHGSKIMAMHPAESSPGIPAFDTEALALTVCPSQGGRGDIGSKPLYASVGGKLLAFVYPYVEVLGPAPPPSDDSWSWADVEPLPPFASSVVSGYAVHPDGRTVFVSVADWRPDVCGRVKEYHLKTRRSTFTFDMERLEWAHAGEWLLPFEGRGYYDRELDSWVGLRLRKDKEEAGRVCSCDVPAPPAAGCEAAVPAPAWKLGRDVLFDAAAAGGHLGATLVYKGDGRFCLAESRRATADSRPRVRVVKMISFAPKYDKVGDLRTTCHRAYASVSYQIAHELIDRTRDPVVFWI